MRYKFLEHTADVKFTAFGRTMEEAFENAALALKETICGKKKIKNKKEKKIDVRGNDPESMLNRFLGKILYLFDAENFLIGDVKKIKIDEKTLRLSAVISGDDAENYNVSNSVKAITYNDMFVKKDKNRWIVQAVLDV